jgi:hypothetical protein
MDIFTLYSILPVDCDFATSPENVTGLYAGGFAIALATGPCVTGRDGPVDTGDVGSGGGGGGFLPELFEFVFNNLAFSSARVSITFLCCFLIVSLFCCGDGCGGGGGGGGGEFVPELFELLFKMGLVFCYVYDFGGGGGGGGGEFVSELFELRFAKVLVSCPVDDFGGGCSTVEGFLTTVP